jgi:hypothetical protein
VVARRMPERWACGDATVGKGMRWHDTGMDWWTDGRVAVELQPSRLSFASTRANRTEPAHHGTLSTSTLRPIVGFKRLVVVLHTHSLGARPQ